MTLNKFLNTVLCIILHTFLISAIVTYGNEDYVFYYESYIFALDNHKKTQNSNNNKNYHYQITINNNITINFDKEINDNNLSLNNNIGLIYINYNNNTFTESLIIDYNNDNEWNEIQIPDLTSNNHANRRRLWSHWHWHWHPSITRRSGRFIAYSPGGWGSGWWWNHHRGYTYESCRHHCSFHFGGIASILSSHEMTRAQSACYHAARHKHHRSCWIGLKRPWKKWDDGKKVTYTNWYPGEPNNWGHHWGHHEDCAHIWSHRHGKWNDAHCNGRLSCLCEDPRGVMAGRFIAVRAERSYHSANQYCYNHYGTSLATIENQQDNDDVVKACEGINTIHGGCWIGLKYPHKKWIDGTKATRFDNWAPGEPNNVRKGGEECTEILHRDKNKKGKWNDLWCWYKRGIVCNAETALQRMPQHHRNSLIAKRLHFHKWRWRLNREKARRRKLSKELWERLQKQKEAFMKQRLLQHEELRNQLRNKIFSNAFNTLKSPFDTVYTRRRRRLKKQKEKERYNDMIIRRKTEIDDDNLFDMMKDIENNQNELLFPIKCIFINNQFAELYEICMDYVYIKVKKYMKKLKRNNESDIIIMDYVVNDFEEYNYNYLTFMDFEKWKYKQTFRIDEFDISFDDGIMFRKANINPHFNVIYNKEYDYNSNHKLQCWDDINTFKICLELNNDIVIFSLNSNKFNFDNNYEWNEITNNYIDNKIISIEKCVLVYNAKICVIKSNDNQVELKMLRAMNGEIDVDGLL